MPTNSAEVLGRTSAVAYLDESNHFDDPNHFEPSVGDTVTAREIQWTRCNVAKNVHVTPHRGCVLR